MAKIVVMLRGGPDSSTLVAHLLNQGNTVRGLVIDYGQNPRTQEVAAARAISLTYSIPLDIFNLSALRDILLFGA